MGSDESMPKQSDYMKLGVLLLVAEAQIASCGPYQLNIGEHCGRK